MFIVLALQGQSQLNRSALAGLVQHDRDNNKYHFQANMENTLNKFNKLQPSIKFTIEKELHESLNILDLTIDCKDRNLQFAIYKEPTQTDILIPNFLCHPYEHSYQVLTTYYIDYTCIP
jgi:uncharacterized membrane protein